MAPTPTGYLHLGHAQTFWSATQRARRAEGEHPKLGTAEDLPREIAGASAARAHRRAMPRVRKRSLRSDVGLAEASMADAHALTQARTYTHT